jgi:ADP-ribose pyrophosphatase YjhB (NUDIX family)
MNKRQPILIHCFALVVCRHIDGRWLCIKESKNRGWWISGGLVTPGEDFYIAAIRHAKAEACIKITIKGILRIEYSICSNETARMRVIYYATSSDSETKQISDDESEYACWLTLKEIQNLANTNPGLRGHELLDWPRYIENKGVMAPLSFMCDEVNPINVNESEINTNMYFRQKEDKNDDQKLFIDTLLSNDVKAVKEMLLHKNIDINMPINKKQWTPLHYAIKIKSEELVTVLLLYKAKVNVLTKKNRNCIHFAVQAGMKVMKALLISISNSDNFNEYLNAQDCYGKTPLHISANDIATNRTQSTKLYNLLINFGASVEIKNKEGLTPLDILNLKL